MEVNNNNRIQKFIQEKKKKMQYDALLGKGPLARQAPEISKGPVLENLQDRFENMVQAYEQYLNFTDQLIQQAGIPETLQPLPETFTTTTGVDEQLLQNFQKQIQNSRQGGILRQLFQRHLDKLKPMKHQEHIEGTKTLKQWGDMKMPDKLYKLGTAWETRGKTIAEGEVKYARGLEVNEKLEGQWGQLTAQGYTDFLKAQGRVYGDYDLKNMSAYIGAGGRLSLVDAHYQVNYQSPTVNLAGHEIGLNANAKLDAFVGAQGNIEADISLLKDPHLKIGGEAFVGASATIQGQAALGDMAEIHGSATGWVGAGVKGNLDVGFEDGKFTFDIGFGAALGLGFDVDWGFTIDFKEIGETLVDVGDAILDGIGDVGEAIGDAVDAVGDFAEDVADAVGDAVDAVGDAISDAADAVGDFVSDVGDAISSVFSGW